jgi:CubicO group peptidase (beta-lactamase class C family)
MPSLLRPALLVTLALRAAAPVVVAAPLPVPDPRVAAFDAYAAKGARDWKVPGLAVALVKDGRVLLARAYGVREQGRVEPSTTRTAFAIGSTTKAMTAAGVAMLVDEGKVGWDDPVVRHLPGFRLADPWLTAQVTVRDLLTHRAGMPNADFLWYRTESGPAEVLRRFALVKPESSLRSRFRYQNVMYHAAGELVAAVSGKPWAEFVKERLFGPLGMADTVPLLASRPAGADVASPHFERGGVVKVIQKAAVDNVAAAGSVWSSVADMAKWAVFLLEGGKVGEKALLTEASLQELFTPQTIVGKDGFYPTARLTKPRFTTYGLGWFQQDYAGRSVDFHTGSIDGMVAILGLVREERLGVVVLANLDHAELRHALMLRAFDTFGSNLGRAGEGAKSAAGSSATRETAGRDWSAELLKLYSDLRAQGQEERAKLEKARVSGTRPSLAMEAYAGRYADPLYGDVKILAEGGALRLDRGLSLGGRLEHWHYDTWRTVPDLEWVDAVYVRFVLDAQGRPSRLGLGDLGEAEDAWAWLARQEEKK